MSRASMSGLGDAAVRRRCWSDGSNFSLRFPIPTHAEDCTVWRVVRVKATRANKKPQYIDIFQDQQQ